MFVLEQQMKGRSGTSDRCRASIGLFFLAWVAVCAHGASVRAVEANSAVLNAALDYLRGHVAMEILSRSQCSRHVTPRGYEVSGFGTRVFLEEASEFLLPQELELLNQWLLSESYRETVAETAHRIYEIISLKPNDRSRCDVAVHRYGSLLSRSRADFRRLRPERVEPEPLQRQEAGGRIQFDENSNCVSSDNSPCAFATDQAGSPPPEAVEDAAAETTEAARVPRTRPRPDENSN